MGRMPICKCGYVKLWHGVVSEFGELPAHLRLVHVLPHHPRLPVLCAVLARPARRDRSGLRLSLGDGARRRLGDPREQPDSSSTATARRRSRSTISATASSTRCPTRCAMVVGFVLARAAARLADRRARHRLRTRRRLAHPRQSHPQRHHADLSAGRRQGVAGRTVTMRVRRSPKTRSPGRSTGGVADRRPGRGAARPRAGRLRCTAIARAGRRASSSASSAASATSSSPSALALFLGALAYFVQRLHRRAVGHAGAVIAVASWLLAEYLHAPAAHGAALHRPAAGLRRLAVVPGRR